MMIPALYPHFFKNIPAGMAIRKYARKIEVSINVDCLLFNSHAFFKCGIRIEFMLCAIPHKKNKLVTRIKGIRYLFLVSIFMNSFFLPITNDHIPPQLHLFDLL